MLRAEGQVVCLAQANGRGLGKSNYFRAEGPFDCQIAGPSALTNGVFACHPGRWPGLGKWLGLWPEIHLPEIRLLEIRLLEIHLPEIHLKYI